MSARQSGVWIASVTVLLWGVLLLFAWFANETAYAGIPYPHPTPALAARYAYHHHVGEGIALAGFLTVATGAVGLGILLAMNAVAGRRPPDRV
jgi:hypothetical protein